MSRKATIRVASSSVNPTLGIAVPGFTAAAVLVLRVKRPNLERPYRTLGYPFVPVLFALGAAILLVSTFFDRRRESLMGIAIMAAGLPFYSYWKSRRH